MDEFSGIRNGWMMRDVDAVPIAMSFFVNRLAYGGRNHKYTHTLILAPGARYLVWFSAS